MIWRWLNFAPDEVLSPDGLKIYERGVLPLRELALDTLEVFRTELGLPIIINSGPNTLRGFRSPKEHLSLARENQFSFHCQGVAFDISVRGMGGKELYEKAIRFGWRGVILYPTWVHVDLRDGDPFYSEKR